MSDVLRIRVSASGDPLDGKDIPAIGDATGAIKTSGTGGSGPTTAGLSTSFVAALSTVMCSWQVTATTAVKPLVPAWTAGAAYLAGEVVTNGGNMYRCSVAGTAAGSGGPTGTGAGAITDNTATWRYVAAFQNGGVTVVNTDASNLVYYGTDPAITAVKATGALPPFGGFTLPVPPTLINVISGGSVIIAVTAFV